jgi:hypothetical protein
MAIIATYAHDHETPPVIIDWAREPWPAIKQYGDLRFAYIIIDIEEDEEPVSVELFGPKSSHTFDFGGELVKCDNVYKSATITTRKVEV